MTGVIVLWPDPRSPGSYRVHLPKAKAGVGDPVRAAVKCGGRPIDTVAER